MRADQSRRDHSAALHAPLLRTLQRSAAVGDLAALAAVLHRDVTLVTDAAGAVAWALTPLRGAAAVTRWAIEFFDPAAGTTATAQSLNGQPGLLLRRGALVVAALTIDVWRGRISDIWVVMTAVKLQSFNRG